MDGDVYVLAGCLAINFNYESSRPKF